VVALLPIVTLPTTASLTNTFAPTVSELVLAGPSTERVVMGMLLIAGTLLAVYALLLVGSWLELALLRETARDAELELGWSTPNASPATALGVRLVAHVPTLLAAAYAMVRITQVAYVELTAPGDTTVPLVFRVLGQALDAPLAVGITWLLGETAGGLAAKRVAAGEPIPAALARSIRQVASPQGLATLAVTTAALLALAVPYVLAVSAGWGTVRVALYEGGDAVTTLASVLLLVGTWILGLALLAVLLAWRATAWTVQIAPRSATVTQPMLRASEPTSWG
jgi:hypothetical protein